MQPPALRVPRAKTDKRLCNMALSKKQRQWLWFAALWVGGLVATLVLARLIRWLLATV
ncbi:MAG: hypothetical protein PVI39_08050 [Desulfobacteraceae bacterium]